MTASSGLSYAADAIEPASVPQLPSSWSPTLWVLIFTAGGFVLGCLLTLIKWRDARHQHPYTRPLTRPRALPKLHP